jgi:hypothetical protein
MDNARAKFLACYWMLGTDPEKSEDWKTAVGAHFVTTVSQGSGCHLRTASDWSSGAEKFACGINGHLTA